MKGFLNRLPNRHEWWSFWGNGIRLAFTALFYVSGTLVIMMGLLHGSKTISLVSMMPEALFWAFISYVPVTVLMLFTRDPNVYTADPIWKLLSKHKDYAARYLVWSGLVLMIGLLSTLLISMPVTLFIGREWSEVVVTMYSYLLWPIIASALTVWHFQLFKLIEEFETPMVWDLDRAEDSADKNG